MDTNVYYYALNIGMIRGESQWSDGTTRTWVLTAYSVPLRNNVSPAFLPSAARETAVVPTPMPAPTRGAHPLHRQRGLLWH